MAYPVITITVHVLNSSTDIDPSVLEPNPHVKPEGWDPEHVRMFVSEFFPTALAFDKASSGLDMFLMDDNDKEWTYTTDSGSYRLDISKAELA